MSLRSTIYKADLAVADVDRGHYDDYSLTIARHPSETEERLMVRLLAFALWADPQLGFAGGLSTDDEPDLWIRDLTGAIDLWISVGLPDERVLRKAAGRAAAVRVLVYGGRRADMWWTQHAEALRRLEHLSVWLVDPQSSQALAGLAQRGMRLSATIQEGQILLSSGEQSLTIEPVRLL